MSNSRQLTAEEIVARFDAARNRVIDERIALAPRGVPERLLRELAKNGDVVAMYPTTTGNWFFTNAAEKVELSHEALIAVLAWRVETERAFDEARCDALANS